MVVKRTTKKAEKVKKIIPVSEPVSVEIKEAKPRSETAVSTTGEKTDQIVADDFIISEKDLKSDKYYEAVGRRKTAVARVRFYTRGEKQFLVNNKPYQEYFFHPEMQVIAAASLDKMNCLGRFKISAKVTGGGPHSQAEAIRHATARVLVKLNPNFRKRLRKAGYLTRDPRMRERKKFGLKRARRAPQWAKR